MFRYIVFSIIITFFTQVIIFTIVYPIFRFPVYVNNFSVEFLRRFGLSFIIIEIIIITRRYFIILLSRGSAFNLSEIFLITVISSC
mmetsp:Transcript_10599/g.951  ORF Transcript_10599/g.951 Transcript_10599/m.951 type:complete len:86 (-) Transcript_10599:95-352(-)